MKSTAGSTLAFALIRALPRCAVLVVLDVAITARSDYSNYIGYGILFFASVVFVSFVWAIVDGTRRALRAAWLPWLGTALLFAVVVSVGGDVIDALAYGSPLEQARLPNGHSLTGLAFWGGLVVFPAGFGLLIGYSIREITAARRAGPTSLSAPSSDAKAATSLCWLPLRRVWGRGRSYFLSRLRRTYCMIPPLR